MPGRLFLKTPLPAIATALGANAVGCPVQASRLDIKPESNVVVCDEAKHLREMRWGIVPVGRKNARGKPQMKLLINARSETVFDKSVYEGMGRCVVPADGWYEWTGEVRKKTRWRINAKSGQLLFFAAIYDVWKGPGGIEVPQVATLTCEPNQTVKDIHHRMGALLEPALIDPWLRGEDVPLEPAPNDLLAVEDASDLEE